MNIQPIRRPINYHEYIDWKNNCNDNKERYDDFINEIVQSGKTKEQANEMWLKNFGNIPANEPDRIYQCNILDSSIKLVVTVLRRNDADSENKFKVVCLNHLFLDGHNSKRVMTKENGMIKFKVIDGDIANLIAKKTSRSSEDLYCVENDNGEQFIIKDNVANANIYTVLEYEDNEEAFIRFYDEKTFNELNKKDNFISIESDEEYYANYELIGNYALNYEDSNWFTNMSISYLLNRLKVKIKPYQLPSEGEEPKRPSLFINNLDFMESTEIEIVDEVFKEKLFAQIERKFLDIEDELK